MIHFRSYISKNKEKFSILKNYSKIHTPHFSSLFFCKLPKLKKNLKYELKKLSPQFLNFSTPENLGFIEHLQKFFLFR